MRSTASLGIGLNTFMLRTNITLSIECLLIAQQKRRLPNTSQKSHNFVTAPIQPCIQQDLALLCRPRLKAVRASRWTCTEEATMPSQLKAMWTSKFAPYVKQYAGVPKFNST